MYKKINLCFVLIAVSIAGNGMAKYLLVDVAEEKRISDEGAGKLLTEHDYGDRKWKIINKSINSKLNFYNDPQIKNYRKWLKFLSSFKDVSSYDMCEYALCGCYNGCPEGKVCCSCGPCRRGNMCRESCGDECEVPAICKLLWNQFEREVVNERFDITLMISDHTWK